MPRKGFSIFEMRKQRFVSKSSQETMAFAGALAKSLSPGTILALEGPLGSGKTTFMKGLAVALGVKSPDEVKSPTFVVMHIYRGHIPIYHFDLYRLESTEELEAIGFEEFIYDRSAVSCIEWAEKAERILPEITVHIHFEVTGEDERTITVQKPNSVKRRISR